MLRGSTRQWAGRFSTRLGSVPLWSHSMVVGRPGSWVIETEHRRTVSAEEELSPANNVRDLFNEERLHTLERGKDNPSWRLSRAHTLDGQPVNQYQVAVRPGPWCAEPWMWFTKHAEVRDLPILACTPYEELSVISEVGKTVVDSPTSRLLHPIAKCGGGKASDEGCGQAEVADNQHIFHFAGKRGRKSVRYTWTNEAMD